MDELLIKKQKYLQVPLDINKLAKSPDTVEKLSLHLCSNSKIQITDVWSRLEYIEIIGCRYLELSFSFTQPSHLKQIFFASTDYVDILDFSGTFLNFSKWRFEGSRYVKFKGPFTGNNHLQSLQFVDSPNCEVFKSPTSLPYLLSLDFLDGCNFTKLDLNLLTAPKLNRLWFRNSNYVNIVSLGTIEAQLQSFKFENCAYPKLNVDFSKLARITPENQATDLNDENPLVSLDKAINPFRNVKRRPRPKKNPVKRNIRNDPDMVLMRETLSNQNPIQSAEAFLKTSSNSVQVENPEDPSVLPDYNPSLFLNSLRSSEEVSTITSSNQGDPKVKFCSNCGFQNPERATFCSGCGTKFQPR